jgi:hypothetical protein
MRVDMWLLVSSPGAALREDRTEARL